MTKGEFIDSVLLAVSGGNLSPDINITRQDIAARLAISLTSAVTGEVEAEKLMAARMKRVFGVADMDFRPGVEFMTTYETTPSLDSNRDLYYIALPKKLTVVKGNAGLDSVFPKAQNVQYVMLRDPFEVQGMPLLDTTYTWFERYSGEERVYFKNLSLPVGEVGIRMIADVTELEDDDFIPIPGGLQEDVLERVVAFFMRTRGLPADEVANDVDDEVQNNRRPR
jgi:hypothetical protein